jgi:RimJ/RimL family protein N-acetyltransferase
VLVRQATASDAEGFATVVAAVAEEGWIATQPPVDVAAFAERVRGMLADDHRLFVLDDGGRIVGTLGLQRSRAPGVASLGMTLLAEVRGLGHGGALLRAAIEHARGMQMHKVELEVWPDNARAIALYEKFGFEVEGLRRDHYRRDDGSLRSSLLMALLLDDQPRSSEAGT